MIPEIEEKFKIINWMRERKIGYDDEFEKLPVQHQANIVALNATIESLIGKLQSEINEIAKEHGNSYVDDNGATVWVESKLKWDSV